MRNVLRTRVVCDCCVCPRGGCDVGGRESLRSDWLRRPIQHPVNRSTTPTKGRALPVTVASPGWPPIFSPFGALSLGGPLVRVVVKGWSSQKQQIHAVIHFVVVFECRPTPCVPLFVRYPVLALFFFFIYEGARASTRRNLQCPFSTSSAAATSTWNPTSIRAEDTKRRPPKILRSISRRQQRSNPSVTSSTPSQRSKKTEV